MNANISTPVRPTILIYPVGVAFGGLRGGAGEDDEADPRMAVADEPIIGVDRVVYDDATGHGALAAKPLSSPKTMSAAQRAIHDITPSINECK